ncbi:AAA family ATPase [Falsiroseomonas sp. E2-1-a4]|uniref:AAA family ATPase n=1 Tax=Falsiroseomonas sp. E2-1-a4 TaxID=3239299 RepID=UPI003F320775
MRGDLPREAADQARGGGRAAGAGRGDRAPFLAFVQDEASEAAIRGGLAAFGGGLAVRRGGIATAIKALEREATPLVLLVDIAGIDDPMEQLEALAGICTPDLRMLVLGDNSEISFYRQLTRDLGVAEYVHKPLTRDGAERLFGPFLRGGEAETEAARRGGQVVAVCGARGGVGATTVAVNLALQLADVSRGHVALLDLNLRGGTTGLMLGVRPAPGLRVALEDPERVDGLFLERCAAPIGERLKLIAAEEPMDAMPQPTIEGVAGLLGLLRQRFNYVVVDLPMPPGPAERAVLAASRLMLLVMGPDVAGIRDAIAARKLAAGGAARMMTVLNREGLPGGLKRKHILEGLGATPEVTIPDLPKLLPRAANLGKPALNAVLRRALAPVTEEVAAVHSGPVRTGLMARLFGGRT